LIAPVRGGSGIRDEILAALAHGLPVVTTGAGVEGLHLTDGLDALIADGASKFAAAVVQAYRDEALWNRLAANGLRYANAEFSAESFRLRVEAMVARLRTIPAARSVEDYLWSARIVEAVMPALQVQSDLPGPPAFVLRMHAYAAYAEGLLDEGQPEEACRQLRHIFAFAPPPLPPDHFFANVLNLMERGYRALGDHERGARCGREALQFIPELRGKFSPQPARNRFAGDRVPGMTVAHTNGGVAAERSPA
jgi:hypothetical protein